MTDSILLSLENSPVAQTLIDQSDVSDWIYSVKTSMAPVSKNRYVIEGSSVTVGSGGVAAKSNVKFELQRYGVLMGVTVRIKINYTENNAAEGALCVRKGGGLNFLEEVRLQSRNRTIQTLTPQYQYSKLMEMPEGVRDQLKSLMWYDGGAQVAAITQNTTGDVYCYVPLFFSNLWDLKNSIDTQFAETLQISMDLSKIQASSGANSAAQILLDVPSFSGSDTNNDINTYQVDLICYYANFPTDIYRSIQDKNYNIQPGNKSLNYVLEDTYVEAAVESSSNSAVGTSQKINVPLNCRNLAKRITILALNKTTDDQNFQGVGAGIRVDKVVLRGNGKEIYEIDSNELILQNALLTGRSRQMSGTFTNVSANPSDNSNENLFILDFGFSLDKDHYSGACSLKGVSNPSLDVYVSGESIGATAAAVDKTTNKVTIYVEVEYYNVVSLNPMDGKFSVSSNL